MPKKRKQTRSSPPVPQGPISTWAEYRKNFILTQFFIVVFLTGAYFWGRVAPIWLGLAFISTQLGAIIGAWMGAGMKRRMISSKDRLPLE
jgi:hypothetical protein